MSRNQRLNATLTIGAALQSSVRRNLDVVGRGLKQVGSEISTINTRKRELDKQRRVLERQGESVTELDKEYQKLNDTLRGLEDRQRRLRDVQNAAGQVGSAFSNMRSEVSRFGRRAAVVVGGAAASVFGLSNSTAKMGDEVAKSADRIGIGTDALQELRYAGERAGVGAESVDSALDSMNRNIGQAEQGLGRARKSFDELNLSAEELGRMSAEERFLTIVDSLEEVESATKRAALEQTIFGENLITMTREGRDGINKLREDARALGIIIPEDAARGAEDFQDALHDARESVRGLRNTIGSELMPVVGDAMKDFTGYLRDNRESVERFAKALGEGMREALPVVRDIGSGLATIGRKVGDGISKLAEFVGGWDRLGGIIGTVFAGKALASIGTFAWSLGRLGWAVGALVGTNGLAKVAKGIGLVGKAILKNPIGLAILAVAGGAWLIKKNWESISEWFARLWDNVGDIFKGAGELIAGIFTLDMERAKDGSLAIWEAYQASWETIWAGITGTAEYAWEKGIAPLLDRMGALDWVEEKWASFNAFIGEGMTEALKMGEVAWERFSDALSKIVDWLGERFQWLLDRLAPILNAGPALREIGGNARDAVKERAGAAVDYVADTRVGRWVSGLRKGDPQERAVGGTFSSARPLLVGEQGAELLFPNRGGFIATNRQLKDMAGKVARIGAVSAALGTSAVPAAAAPDFAQDVPDAIRIPAALAPDMLRDAPGALRIPAAAAPDFAQDVPEVMQTPSALSEVAIAAPRQSEGSREPANHSVSIGDIHIHAAPGMDGRALFAEFERELKRRGRSALYDIGATRPGG